MVFTSVIRKQHKWSLDVIINWPIIKRTFLLFDCPKERDARRRKHSQNSMTMVHCFKNKNRKIRQTIFKKRWSVVSKNTILSNTHLHSNLETEKVWSHAPETAAAEDLLRDGFLKPVKPRPSTITWENPHDDEKQGSTFTGGMTRFEEEGFGKKEQQWKLPKITAEAMST